MSAESLASSPPTVTVVMPTRGSEELVARSLLGALADPTTFEAPGARSLEDAGNPEKNDDQVGSSRLASPRRVSQLSVLG
jgi:hypothetical protein